VRWSNPAFPPQPRRSSRRAWRGPVGTRNRTQPSFLALLNLAALAATYPKVSRGHRPAKTAMKIAFLALLGLLLGGVGGAVLGVGAGLAWVEIFQTSSLEGYSGMLVFFTFMPLGAGVGGLGGALLFAVMAIRDAEIAIEREPARRRDR
jgi:hypothetical protein